MYDDINMNHELEDQIQLWTEVMNNALHCIKKEKPNATAWFNSAQKIVNALEDFKKMRAMVRTNTPTIIGLAHTILNEGGHVTKNEHDLAKALVLIEQRLKTGSTGEYLTDSIWHALNAAPYSPEKKDTSHIMQSFNPD